jgi:hypothetical protein
MPVSAIVPYEPLNDIVVIPPCGQTQPGLIQGVFLTLDASHVDMLLAKFSQWFVDRPEVRYVDHGTTDKREDLGYIILEWHDATVDPLFVAILHSEELIEDFTVYTRFQQED